jgi:flotillin
MAAVLLIIISFIFYGAGIFGSSFSNAWNPSNTLVMLALGTLFFIVGLTVYVFTQFYIKPSANLAYVKTGLGGRSVLIDKGGLFIPLVHRLVPVSLETMKLEVERKGPDALITKDNLRVDVKAEFYIKVHPDDDAVMNASRSLGEKSVTAQDVAHLVFEKLVSALRSVAATKDLVEIHSQRNAFASGVQDLVRADLEPNGLSLESVTISKLDQTNQDLLSDTNIFDAQGKRKITEITQSAMVERNRIEQEARREMTIKNVATGREILELERARAEAEATQRAQVAKIQAEQNREAETYRLEQERQVKEAEIAQQQAVQTAAIQRDREVILREQERQTTDVEREKAVQLAQREREIAITDAERRRAETEKQALEAQAEREKANQSIITVQQLAQAEREAQTRLIGAKQSIEQDRFKRQTDAEITAFAEVKKAEASKQSAQLEAEATLRRAEAEASARSQLAKGDTALKKVDVDIAREQVDVERARVEVEKQALENKQTFSAAALEFELEKLRVEAQRDVQSRMAEALGQMLSKGNMNIYGDPETLAKMNQQFARGLGLSTMVDGAIASFEGKESFARLAAMLEQLGVKVPNLNAKDATDSSRHVNATASATTDGATKR